MTDDKVAARQVKYIHDIFDTAGERIIAEAEAILSTAAKHRTRASRLLALGFESVPEAKEARQAEEARTLLVKQAEMIQAWAIKYPLVKFITKAEIEKVCEKYSLLFGRVWHYKGSIPEKNLEAIESWKGLDPIDEVPGYYAYLYGEMSRTQPTSNYSWTECKSAKNWADVSRPDSNYLTRKVILDIVAPKDEMDTDGHWVDGVSIVPDPIVLCRTACEDVYAIITAWGPEANDPLVANPILN